ncbi:MAG: histidine phosphatase family protein, partial [Muribaculaceae bacterium]|nr:histidine phosphatase family protein [Muribaculaceae bacterium]
MSRRIVIFLLVLFSIPAFAVKKSVVLPTKLSGSMMPYDFSDADTVPIWPDSLKPVYVARVARHGARYITSAKKLTKLKKEIAKASEAGTLTKEGRKFSSLLQKVEETTGSQWGRLSEVGCREEQILAEDLYRLLPKLMRDARVNAISSYIPRVVMTMYQFNHQLTTLSSRISISASEGREYNYLLRCFSADSLYSAYRDKGNWVKISEGLTDSIVSPEPARRLFGAKCGLSDKELRGLTLRMYDILQSLTAFGMDAPTDEFM